MTLEEAHAAVDAMLGKSGPESNADARIVIEEFMEGEEVSFIVMPTGVTCCRLLQARITSA